MTLRQPATALLIAALFLLTAPAPAIRFSAILKCSSPPLHHSCSSPDDGSQVS